MKFGIMNGKELSISKKLSSNESFLDNEGQI